MSAPKKGSRWSSFPEKFHAVWKRCSSFLKSSVQTVFPGSDTETEKYVVRTGWKHALGHCGVHILPSCAVILLSYFNLAGFFIGSNLQGAVDDVSQDFYRLLLQITAKIIELFIIASLGVVIMDATRHALLFGDEGVTLGLLFAKFRFADVRYLFSVEFLAGWKGFKRNRMRVSFGLLITASSVIAVLCGPSVALLVIPIWHESWPAGSATFWVNGDLHPPTLDRSPSWDPRCNTISNVRDHSKYANSSVASCIWAGFPFLQNAFRQRASSGRRRISYSDGTFEREITFKWGVPYPQNYPSLSPDSVRVSAYASNLAIGSFSQYIKDEWCNALFTSPDTRRGKPLANLRYRQYNGTEGSVRGQLPLVRTQCLEVPTYTNDTVRANATRMLPFPIIPDYEGRRDLMYYLPVALLHTSQLATRWIPVPSDYARTSYNQALNQYPSAFLLIQNYNFGEDKDVNSTLTCSVQANWAPGTNVASSICFGEQRTIEQRGVLDDAAISLLETWSIGSQLKPDEPIFRKVKDWQQINLTTDWLNSLTPSLKANETGATTLAATLEETTPEFFPNHVWWGQKKTDIFITINAVVASFVADGLSRTGHRENYADQISKQSVLDGCWTWQGSTWREIWTSILRSKAHLRPDDAHRQPSGEEYVWYATVGGYGLKATGTAYFLALVVLYVYEFLVVCHVAYTMKKRLTSRAWSSLPDILVLSQTSPEPLDVLKNTSAGISTHAALKAQLRVRKNKKVTVGKENLQLLVGEDGAGPDFEPVEAEKEYGCQG